LHARLTLVLHYFDAALANQDPVETVPASTAYRARRLITCAVRHAVAFYSNFGGKQIERVRSVASWIFAGRVAQFASYQLTRDKRFCRGMSLREVSDLLSPLVVGGWIEPETEHPNN
jgi:hypothetical protein